MTIEDQPAPKATDRQPMWPAVVEYVQNNYCDNGGGRTVTDLVDDMTARDAVGRERYGVPLTSGNGRDHLIDAYQEALDLSVYLRTWLDERGISPMTPDDVMTTEKRDLTVQERSVCFMFGATIEMLLQMRGIISNAPAIPNTNFPLERT